MLYFLTLLPVVCFLLILMWLDSFSLIRKRYLIIMFAWGLASAYLVDLGGEFIERYTPISPLGELVSEEFFKGLGVFLLIRMRKSAFFIDAAVYGAASGAGFAFLENIVYVNLFPDMTMGTAIMRGFGTAIMHCGAVAGTAALLSWFDSHYHYLHRYYPIAILPAIAIHYTYNSFVLPPMVSLTLIMIGVTVWLIFLFMYNEKSIAKWLDMELASEIEMLSSMRRGEFSKSRGGQYMLSIRDQFHADRFLNMYCYVQLYFELSIAAKTNMMLREAGFPTVSNKELSDKANEFCILRKKIGKTGRIALSPLIKMDRVTVWEIESLM